MKAYQYQIDKADACWQLLKELGYVYLGGKPRSGKTLTSILIAERSKVINNVLVLTKKAAIGGWDKFINDDELQLKHTYHVTNYEQAHKLNANDYELVIIDESHNLGTLAKPSKRIKTIQNLCKNLPHIHLSGTAIVESPNGIYHQMAISTYTPFKHKNFYDYFREFGKPYYIRAAGREITQYDRADMDRLMPLIDRFTVYMTQEDAGISSDVQAEDKLHYIELDEGTKKLYNELQEHNIATICHNFVSYDLVCDTVMKLRTSLHMLESGVAKIGDDYLFTGNTEKIAYIKKTFGDSEDVGIMCHFVGEQQLLAKHFKKAQIFSSSSHAEGVDLSHLNHFVILSSNYSGAKHIQRRERIINVNGSNTLTVNHILVKGAISEQVYKRVSKKEDFNNSTYEGTRL